MQAILMSINPEHVRGIFGGSKKFEYRTLRTKRDVDRILIYCTSPVCRIVGEARIVSVIEDEPPRVWDLTKNASGIDRRFFDDYFRQRNHAIAYELADVIRYDVPRELCEYGVSKAPQSYRYVEMNLPVDYDETNSHGSGWVQMKESTGN